METHDERVPVSPWQDVQRVLFSIWTSWYFNAG